MSKKIISLFAAICLILNSSFVFAQSPDDSFSSDRKKVTAIEVVGNKTISLATILSKIKTRVGQDYLQNVISEDLKRLYNTGYFSDVRVDRAEDDGGFKVTIFVEEKPIVEEITFSKTKHVKKRTIERKIQTKAGKFLDKKSLKDDAQLIKDLYEQKGLTTAEVDPEMFVDEVTNKASIHFVIREGQKLRIKDINVYGNTAFKDKKIKKVIKTKEDRFWKGRYLNEDILKEDIERLRSFYEQEGYIDATADYTVEYLYEGDVAVNIQLEEGKRYYLGDIIVAGNKIISDKEVTGAMETTEAGNIFSREKLSLDLANVRSLYFDRGYIFATVKESTSLDSDTGKVDLRIDIEEGGLAYIEKIKIQGNTRTRDIVIRRELRMTPGDRFDGSKLRRSRERLQNLGYFEDINFDVEDTAVNDRKNLLVQVKETKTGTFSFGGGFSTVDKFVGFIELEQRNFDFTNWPSFTGGGQRLQLRAETGASKNNLLLSFTEPWIFDHPVSGGFDLYRNERERENDTGYAYDQEILGGGIRLGKQFTERVSGGLSYKYERVDISNFADNVSAALLAEAGTNRVSVFGTSLDYDTRDSIFSPTKGLYLSGGAEVAGKYIGGEREFYRLKTRNSYYVPFKWDSVLELRLQTGIVDDYGDSSSVPIFERFFAGGVRTIRGYEERAVGPKDAGNGDPIGGEAMFIVNAEYTIPVVEFIKLAAFFDAGQVWAEVGDFFQDDLAKGVGLGLRIKTPIGPVSLDYGIPLDDLPGEDNSGQFYFSVSRGF